MATRSINLCAPVGQACRTPMVGNSLAIADLWLNRRRVINADGTVALDASVGIGFVDGTSVRFPTAEVRASSVYLLLSDDDRQQIEAWIAGGRHGR